MDPIVLVIILVICACILFIVSLILYKITKPKSSLKLFAPKYTDSNTKVSLFQWNTHYECFTTPTNDDCCSKPLTSYLNNNLVSRHIDFANFSMFENKDYKPPDGYEIINPFSKPDKLCGRDITSLVYNTKWTADSENGKYPYYNCFIPKTDPKGEDRSYVIQKFTKDDMTIYVIGAHFSHKPLDSIRTLATSLKSLGITANDNIIMMADTNDVDPKNPTKDSDFLKELLGGVNSTISNGTGPLNTCCCSDTPAFKYKTDRIISNFGSPTKPQLGDLSLIFPNIKPSACSKVSSLCSLGEMHLPLYWVLNIEKNNQHSLKDVTQGCKEPTASTEQSVDCPVGKYCSSSFLYPNYCADLDESCNGSVGCNCKQSICDGTNCAGTKSSCREGHFKPIGTWIGGKAIYSSTSIPYLSVAMDLAKQMNFTYIVWTDGGFSKTQYFSNDLSPLKGDGSIPTGSGNIVQQVYKLE